MTRLYIAEKPSLGRAIADALPKPHSKQNGYIQCADGSVVTWCIGHLLEQADPDEYDSRYKKWNSADLPIVPDQWILKPRKSSSKQLTVVKKLIKSSSEIIHAGDPDREGQLLVDEVIDYCKVPKAKKQTISRLLISDLNLSAVKKALSQLKSNQEFVPLSVSALARSRADWLYGMNMTRAYTLLGQKAGYQGVLSVGRVQTPVLGLVVRRDQEIDNFVAKTYYTLEAHVAVDNPSGTVIAKWKPSKACEAWQDEEGRVLNRQLVEHVAKKIANQPATVTLSEHKTSKQNAPLPYSLSALQIDASKRFGMSAQQVLDTCQGLYEKHKLITYPRSDCRYLPKGHFSEASSVLSAISNNSQPLQSAVQGANTALRSKAWNDAKVEAHHAIIPTSKSLRSAVLGKDEANVYQLIARQYLMQFYPAAEYAEAQLGFDIEGGEFTAKGKTLLSPGWRSLLERPSKPKNGSASNEPGSAFIPKLLMGSTHLCVGSDLKEKLTEPPKHFTEATLLQAMTGISRFVQDTQLKKILRETDGLGTEATRAGILDLLVKRGLINRKGKSMLSTPAGRGLIGALPEQSTFPDMTAHWEHQLQNIVEKKESYNHFMLPLTQSLQALIDQSSNGAIPESLRNLPPAKATFRKKRSTYRKRS
ncbi:DNA topoisomerase III [Vibrio sp. qd031]|uniref:DNA topoisomerase III n=1 Tax=Vibrio sp. qd031 TaxID=1603038 RepID=UPI000A119F90|nr:DNA topoisomerase III [Vibrio sp. qd031]ORT49436.1 DNA topoisomerase III [Vibrio sp. qd031]